MPVERQGLLDAVQAMLQEMQAEAARYDRLAAFPHASFDRLREAGLLRATLPEHFGGCGFGYGADGAQALLKLFLLLGEGSLAVARLYEAHVNALVLVLRYGRAGLIRQCAADAMRGELFALWVTDPAEGGLALDWRQEKGQLIGGKMFCSGAGVATRALVTAQTGSGSRMLVVPVDERARVSPDAVKLSGMRAAVTGAVDFTGVSVNADALVGEPGDYLREPVFSAGAWRGSAGALGGLTALVKLHREELRRRQRDGDAHQQARFGHLVIAYETARLWMIQAAARACLQDDSDQALVAYINLARLAVEEACLDAMRLTHRSLGLGAFIAGHQAERICRDLATYLRQPAPDEALMKAAQYYFQNDPPGMR